MTDPLAPAATTSTYVIRGGPEGRERLRVLARVMWPTTNALFERAWISRSARCLDLGCGGGDVTVALARLAPDGRAVGIDIDAAKIELARGEAADAGLDNVEFRAADFLDAGFDRAAFDVAYVRFLLTHLPDPARALAIIREALAPGGVILVEDIDFSGHFCYPESAAFDRYLDLYTRAVRGRGCDPNIGPRLPSLLRDAGFEGVGVNVVQPAGCTGDVKLISPMTLEAIADSVLAAELATRDELHATVDDLYAFANDDRTLMSVPRIVQAWGHVSP